MSQTMNEALRQSRKARGLTQEQLAERVHVSRQTISNWENGRANPDYEMLRTLSEVLETRLTELLGVEEPAEKAAEQAEPEAPRQVETAVEPVQPTHRKGSTLLFCVLTAAVMLAGMFAYQWWQSRPTPPPYPKEWFMEETPAVEGQAHLVISVLETPVRRSDVSIENQYIWEYDMYVREDNGVAFTIDQILEYYFSADGGHWLLVTPGSNLHDGLNRNTVSAGAVRKYSAKDTTNNQIVGKGLVVEGMDANGNELSFRYYIPYSEEIRQ